MDHGTAHEEYDLFLVSYICSSYMSGLNERVNSIVQTTKAPPSAPLLGVGPVLCVLCWGWDWECRVERGKRG